MYVKISLELLMFPYYCNVIEWIYSDGLWMQLSFKCYVGISIPYMRKKMGSCKAMIDVDDLGI